VLHTWGQNLEHHPHVHYIVPAGGLALDGSRWINSSRRFFLPVKRLSRVFRDEFCDQLRELFEQDRLQFHGSLLQLASLGAFSRFLGSSAKKTGSSTQSHPSGCPTRSQLPGPLHPSRRHPQPSTGGLRERSRIIPLARLCPWRQEKAHDGFSR